MVFNRSNGIYRGIVIAVGGLALGGAASEPRKPSTQSEQAEEQTQPTNSLEPVASPLKSANEPDQTAYPCNRDEDNRNSDLCAQWKAADAASDAAEFSGQQVTVGWIGLLLGFITMGAAIAAAWYARTAAIQTSLSADSYKARERAVIVPHVSFNLSAVEVSVENIGPSQAIIGMINSAIFHEKPVKPIKFMFTGTNNIGYATIDPVVIKSGIKHRVGFFSIPVEWKNCYLVSAVMFNDIFRESGFVTVCVKLDCVSGGMTRESVDWSEWKKVADRYAE